MKLYSIILTVLVLGAVMAGFWCVTDLKADDTALSPVKIIPIYRTDGTVTFQVRTVSNHGQYTPRNIGAIWITTESGTFVKTLKRWGNSYLQYLTRWHAATPQGNTTGAVTSATLNTHPLHSVTWNCKNTSNVEVADGNYKVWIEYTESNSSGPYTSVTFTKGPAAVHLTPTALTYFTTMQLDFTPAITIGVPTNMTATLNTSNGVDLSWSAPTVTTGLTGYKLYRDGTVILTISTPATTTFTDTPTVGSHYYYTTAMYGTTESTPSNIASVTVNPVVEPPTSLQATVTNFTTVTLSWTAPASTTGLTSYLVYKDTVLLNSVAPGTTTFTDVCTPGDHTYHVTSLFGITESVASNAVVVTITANQDGTQSPNVTALNGNYPNPFNPETHISFTLANRENASLTIYNYKGQKVKLLSSGNMSAGQHVVTWNGTDDHGSQVASGLYYYKLETDSKTLMRKMILMK